MRKYFITGISRGIGKELFLSLGRTNHVVGLSRLQISYNYNHDTSQVIYSDLNNIDKIIKLNISEYFVKTDDIVFINNAARIEPINPIEDVEIQELLSSFNVNVFSVFIILQKLIKLNLKKELYILNLDTGAAEKPIPGWAAYCSSKSTIHMILDVLKTENIKKVKIRHYDPGIVDTDMQEYIRSRSKKSFPLVEMFRKHKNNNVLKEANDVAKEIIDIINEDCNIS